MACDICGKTGTYLEDLNDQYQTENIKQICSDCRKDVDDHLWKLRGMTSHMNETWIKKFMRHMKERLTMKNKGGRNGK